ncbi:hypothetical protein [Lysinibacillus xylanilyticus]|uniref:hypothetical protein n=1 Tax=Lysinibacillus xylanilyticus TaxID=582475 RepID=UPI003D07316B
MNIYIATVEDIPQIEILFVLAENIFVINLYEPYFALRTLKICIRACIEKKQAFLN